MAPIARRRNLSRTDLPDFMPLASGADGEDTAQFRSWLIRGVLVLAAILVPASLLLLAASTPQLPSPECPARAEPAPPVEDGVPKYHGPPVEFHERYTLVLNSYQRHELLKRAISHYSKCRNIDAIRVVWCEDGLPPTRAGSPGFYSEQKEIRYDVMASSSLNNRFMPLEGLRTEAVLSLDDDILAPCSVLGRAFQTWQGNKRNMVGFYPRAHILGEDCRYQYVLGPKALMKYAHYSIVLTKAAFLHRDYLEMYSNHMPESILQYVEQHHNCEDLAMAFLVANSTGAPPTFVHSARVVDVGKGLLKVKGISTGHNHGRTRSECMNQLVKFYDGVMPLQARRLPGPLAGWLLRYSPIIDFISSIAHGRI